MHHGRSYGAWALVALLLGSAALASVGKASPAPGHFAIGTDGTVADRRTGLRWQRAQAPSTMTQPQAVTYCADLVLGGFDDWRLPAVGELVTLVDEQRTNPAIDSSAFPGTTANYFWTSTPYAGGTYVWRVNFLVGDLYGEDPTLAYYVRCVR